MSPAIISVSRRTDIPAFYGEWFMNRLEQGFAGWVNPFGGRKYLVSLKPEDVACFVFWSKNFIPFLNKLRLIKDMGYRSCFNYTITGLPEVFEGRVADRDEIIDTLKRLSDRYSPEHINWRYDPVVLSDMTDSAFHLENFHSLASELRGYVKRCVFSYVQWYGKVRKHFHSLQKHRSMKIREPKLDFKLDLLNRLCDIADENGMTMYSCCGEALLSSRVRKAHCVDGELISRLFFSGGMKFKKRGTRKECGCTHSFDIGAYDTCPHGCVYCYANSNKAAANCSFKKHDMDSAFLGYSREISDRWIKP
jgi:hypothetical protein